MNNWNRRLQEVLESTAKYDMDLMASWPNGEKANRAYRNRLHQNRRKLMKEGKKA